MQDYELFLPDDDENENQGDNIDGFEALTPVDDSEFSDQDATNKKDAASEASKKTKKTADSKSKAKKREIQFQLDIEDSVAQGIYSNLTLSNFSKEEFVVDFAFLQPQVNKGRIRSRAILSPTNAKRLALLLNKQIEDYEKKFGSIGKNDENPNFRISFN